MTDLFELADEECRALWDELTLGYTEAPGHPLRGDAATYEHVSADEVVVCSGAEEAIYLALTALLRSGDHAIVLWPAYLSLHKVARATGAEVSLIELAHDQH